MKNNCPSLSNSLFAALNIISSSNGETIVCISCLHIGGVVSIDILFIPFKAIFKLLGIGVADIDNISIFPLNLFIFSLSFTQNLCSSSTTKSHKSLKSISSLNNLCVHIIKFIFQVLSLSKVALMAAGFSNLVTTHIFTGKSENLSIAF
jgi:hypothetical protein